MCFIGFNSVPNLIVIMFNLLYPVSYVGFVCKGCVWERKSVWRLKALKTEVFSQVARDLASREVIHAPCTWLECEEWGQRKQAVFRECLAGKAFPWDTCEIFCFARLSFLIHTFCAYTIYTYFTHGCWGVLLRENPGHNPWELEIVLPIIIYTNCLWIFLNSYLSISIPLRGWYFKHLPHPFRVFSEVLGLLGSIGRSQALANAIGRIAGSRELDKTRFQKACWSRSLEGLGVSGRLGLEGGREVFCRVLWFSLQ